MWLRGGGRGFNKQNTKLQQVSFFKVDFKSKKCGYLQIYSTKQGSVQIEKGQFSLTYQ